MEPREICDTLRDSIIWLELTPEKVLNLSEVAESFGVSRTPIKECLIQLHAEGWVLRHGSHFMVTPLSLKRIKEITEIRTVMEVQAALWAMQRMTPGELEALRGLKRKIAQRKNSLGNRQLVELDFKFHRTVFQAAKNAQLAQLLERLLSHYLRFWLSIPRVIEQEAFFSATFTMIEAFEEQDAHKLQAAAARHIKNSIDEIIGTF